MSDDLLKIVGDYAAQVAAAERQAEQRSMDVARAMTELFESGEWVAEWLEQKPEPKRPTARWNPADRNRFIAWQAWKLEQQGRRRLDRTRSWRLLEAATICKICASGTDLAAPSEATFRPFSWFRKNRYEDRIPEVWAIAVELAGGDPTRVTSAHTTQARNEWKNNTFGKRLDGTPRKSQGAINQAATAAATANRIRKNVLSEFAELYRLGGLDTQARAEFAGLLDDLDKFLDDHANGEAA